eukprot:m.601035 g.601035  ORF g.601035 m.601035 type:complete len:57 (+) comp22439_c0_seq1:830-1000(+)
MEPSDVLKAAAIPVQEYVTCIHQRGVEYVQCKSPHVSEHECEWACGCSGQTTHMAH